MKKTFKWFLLGIISVAFIVGFVFSRSNTNKANAEIPEGNTLDTTYDELSVSDLTLDGVANQSMVSVSQNTDVTYNKTDAEGSIVFKFKYDVVNDEKSDKLAFRIHFDVSDDKWDESNALWIRGDGVYFRIYKDSSFTYKKITVLSKGVHDMEFGRIALFKDGEATGNYYVYVKLDGSEIGSSVSPYDSSKMNNTMFFNIKATNVNKMYDAALTHEAPQYVAVSDLYYGSTQMGESITNESKTYNYSKASQPANKSTVFIADVNYRTQEGSQIYITTDAENWNYAGYIWFQKDKVYYGATAEDGTFLKNKEVKYGFTLEEGSSHSIEYGRLAVMNGSTFTGKYHVYFKLDGNVLFGIDQAIVSSVTEAGNIHITGSAGFDYLDVRDIETPKVISISDLTSSGTSVGDRFTMESSSDYQFDNSDHTENYSIVMKFKYQPNDSKQNQIHISTFKAHWDSASSMILNNNGNIHTGKSSLEDSNIGWNNITYAMEVGTVYEVEYARIANTIAGEFAGTYHTYIKVNGVTYKEMDYAIDPTIAAGNNVFITASGKNTFYDINADLTSYETPDEISISNLKKDGNPIGEVITITESTSYTYAATAEHKSVVLKFLYEVLDKDTVSCQFHFSDTWLPDGNGGMIWFRNDKNRIQKVGGGYYEVDPFTENKIYSIELGKIYIESGDNAGKYYIYYAVDGVKKIEMVADSMPDKAALFRTGSNGDKIYDINHDFTQYETPDRISISDLKKESNAVGDKITLTENTTYTYTASAEHKSVVLSFLYETLNKDTVSCQFHFSDTWIPSDNGGMFWFRNDKNRISKVGGGYYEEDPFTENKIYSIELGKIYIESGSNAGKYYIYYAVDGVKKIEMIADSMPDKAALFTTGSNGDILYDVNYDFVAYETPDRISVSDLLSQGYPFGEVITLNKHQTFEYNATAAHKSVVFSFIYDCTDKSTVDCQIHFKDGWIASDNGGMIWLRNDKNRISKVGGGYYEVEAFAENKIYSVELGKIYITEGSNTGKYYIYYAVDGVKKIEMIADSMADDAAIFMTGTNGDALYDDNYLPVEMESGLYIYKYDVEQSGIQFSASIRKDFAALYNVSEAGLIITAANDPSDTTTVKGKIKENGNYYTIKAAIAAIKDENITSSYTAKAYMVVEDEEGNKTTVYSEVITTSYYDELQDLSALSAEQKAVLALTLKKVMTVSVNADNCDVDGAAKTGDFTTSSLVLTGSKESYSAFVLNGKAIKTGDEVKIGYITYKVTLGANTITLNKQEKEMVYGGSEHFVELNSGHDEEMTAANLAPMTSELGLDTIRLDICLGDLFTVNSNNELLVNNGYKAKVQLVIDELKKNGGITDFLAVLWTVSPTEFTIEGSKPWKTHTAPDPVSQAETYLKWLQLNEEAARRCAELFPDIMSYEAWNEPEIMAEENGPLAKPDGTNYSVQEKAKILTDLMYYYNRGLKSVNPDIVLTSPSICCAQKTDEDFSATSLEFLRAIYTAIKDSTPVSGTLEVDTDANNYFQVINLHPYLSRGTTTSNWKTYIKSMHDLAVDNGDGGTEIWITEFGFAYNRESDTQTKMLSVLSMADEFDYITKFYFYKIHDFTDKISTDRWGLYDYDGKIKDIGTAVKNYIAAAKA